MKKLLLIVLALLLLPTCTITNEPVQAAPPTPPAIEEDPIGNDGQGGIETEETLLTKDEFIQLIEENDV
jgi:uncharacterized lipoprotein YajG